MNLQGAAGRLAPSPTGAQHVGNARTYLLAWLDIRSRGGRLLLRIEDIDSPRIKPGAATQAIEDLAWLGLDWDGEPVRQTDRLDRYRAAFERLCTAEAVYPCTCSRSDVAAAASAPHWFDEGPAYPGTCAGRRVADARRLEPPFCWRFRSSGRPASYSDRVLGEQRRESHPNVGDFVVQKADGTPAYQLAVVIDDAEQGVTDVLRGADLVPSTFRQLELYQQLDCSPPSFAHVPLVIGPDGRRLAKRHGDTRLAALRNAGVRPELLLGLLAWSAGLLPEPTPVQARELLPYFSLEKISRKPFVMTSREFEWMGYRP